MGIWRRAFLGVALLAIAGLGSGCTTAVVLVHLHDKLTEGEPLPCARLNSLERALQTRCGPPEPGALRADDVRTARLAQCPLTLSARDPALWTLLPDLLAHGAAPEGCTQAPLVALAQADAACPSLGVAAPREIDAIRWLARADARSVHHDVVRTLSCPQAAAAGLAGVIDEWRAAGLLAPGRLPFNPLGALHPSQLGTALSAQFEADGHDVRGALGAYDGRLPSSFELALQTADHTALDWWLGRAPALVNRVPPSRGANLPWRPLARMLAAGFVGDAGQQRRTVEFLLARGADPWLGLPHEPRRSIVHLARDMKSPLLPLLDPPLRRGDALAHLEALVREH